ncbi:hypothetical protein AB6G21_13260 [Providencia hangzhouensis]|uniref:hypothetical protein n=1 Tax=Providencia hangzhouensis TaxID=3031799 RepID=UPI0034DD8B4C
MLNTGIPYEGWLFKDVFEVLSIDKQNKIIGIIKIAFSNKSRNGESALFASIWLDMKKPRDCLVDFKTATRASFG